MTRKIPDYAGEHFAKHPLDGYVSPRPRITCADGVQYSVQASQYHYCSPRDNVGPWTSFEVWGWNRAGRHWNNEPEGWVSRDAINRRIHRHGGAV